MKDLTRQYPSAWPQDRVTAVDAVRGLVIMVLVPDLFGGFSFHVMAALHPQDPTWQRLGALFSHVEWEGVSVWDMIMPIFILVVGVSLALSRRGTGIQGQAPPAGLGRAAIRSVVLIVLGLTLFIKPLTLVDAAMPYVLLTAGLPVEQWFARLLGPDRALHQRVRAVRITAVLVASCAWIAVNYLRLGNYDLIHIFILIGLAYFPAAALSNCAERRQWAIAVAILLAYAAAFSVYAAVNASSAIPDARSLALAAWAKESNLGFAFDMWFLNLLPRAEPYVGSAHGYHTLQFIPLISTMMVGRIIGARISTSPDTRQFARRLLAWSLVAVLAGYLLSVALSPLVKSVWTPSWAIFSTGLACAVLAGFLWLQESSFGGRWVLRALAPLGMNAALLYTMSARDRWRIVAGWESLVGSNTLDVAWRPVLESLLVLAALWLFATVLQRWRVFVRL